LVLPETVVTEIEGCLRSQHKLLGKMVGMMFPALFGCRTPSELCRVRGWDKHWCVFRAKVATDSGRNLPPIPVEGYH
jgi:hypothetical protein